MTKKIAITMLLAASLTTACAQPQTNTGKGAAYGTAGGAAAGAILGQAIGGDTEATLWGTAIGAALGGLAGAGAGKMMDNQEQEMRQALASSEAASVRREGDMLAVMFKSDMTFDFNSAKVMPGLYTEMDRVSSVMQRYPQTLIRVEGHTDNIGTETYNMDLSRKRAQAVSDLLVQRSISSQRVSIIGFGESNPIASNNTETGRQMNRRVEIKIVPTQ
ncbi:MAG: OmpA family protein [Thermodesulfobacteriota bacterium]|nr:OmpA family protein [Thermodesulfobacteriota bacterium]